VKRLLIRLPGLTDEEARTVRGTGSAVSDLVRVSPASDEWEIRFQRGIVGQTDLQIEFQGESASDQGNELVRTPEFEGARQIELFVGVRGSGRLELDAEDAPRGWQRVDWSSVPVDLENRGDRSVPALCFRVAEPEGPLTVTVQRHDLANALKVLITKADMTTLFSERGPFLTEADLTVEVVDKSTMRVRFPDNAQLFNITVNGDSVPVVREEDAYLFNVSPGTGQSREAAIHMVYSVPDAEGGVRLEGPTLDAPMQNVSWRVVVPPGFDLAHYSGDLQLNQKRSAGSFGMAEYQSLVSLTRASRARSATQLLESANNFLENGDQQQASEALDRAANANALDEATNEDARVELRVLKTQQALLGLNAARQKLYLDNKADVQQNAQMEEAANLNPLLQGKLNYNPQQFDQMVQGNTVEENNALTGIASRLVDQQLAAEPAPGAIDINMPVRGQVLTFTRSMQVDGNAPLRLELSLNRLPHSNGLFMSLVLLAIVVISAIAVPKATT
jgi:hypothetical protein